MNRKRCLLIAIFTLLSLGVILISCGGSGSSGGGVSSNCSVPLLDLTYEQAIANIEQRHLFRKLEADAIFAMKDLTAGGVSVSSAYQFVIASIESDVSALRAVRGIDSIIIVDIATTAIKYNYIGDVETIIGAVQTGTNAGAGSEIPAEIVCKGIQKKLDAFNVISSIMDEFVTDINNGLSPTAARDNAINKINALG